MRGGGVSLTVGRLFTVSRVFSENSPATGIYRRRPECRTHIACKIVGNIVQHYQPRNNHPDCSRQLAIKWAGAVYHSTFVIYNMPTSQALPIATDFTAELFSLPIFFHRPLKKLRHLKFCLQLQRHIMRKNLRLCQIYTL